LAQSGSTLCFQGNYPDAKWTGMVHFQRMGLHDRDMILRRIDEAMQTQGYNDRSLALKAGVYQDAIRDLRRGKTQMLRADRLQAIFAVLGLSDSQSLTVPVTGTVGDGSQIHLLHGFMHVHSFAEPLPAQSHGDFVPMPPQEGHAGTLALRVEGDAMEPFLPAGSIVYYSRPDEDGFDSCLNRLCVIGLGDKRVWLRKLKKGSVYGRYTLSGYNSRDMDDCEITWCAPVIFMRPA
jgi:hypothetical protein